MTGTKYNKVTPKILERIESIVGKENYSISPVELRAYASDSGIHLRDPDVVVRVHSAEEVSEILKLANEELIPVTPRGAGTALCGHAVPIFGGIILDMQAMNRIKEVHIEDFYVVVEPGVVYAKLNEFLKPKKFFFPPAPGSGDVATIGGMVIANASGVNAVKYGATRDYVMGLEIVLPTGEIMHSGTRTLKNSSGFQLDRLMVASEGMLGVVTEITLRVVPLPKKKALAMAAFDDLEKAGQCVANIVAYPLIPGSLELMDSTCIQAVNNATDLNLPECEGLLFIGVDGHPAVVKEELEIVVQVARDSGAILVESTDDPAQIVAMMKGRKSMIPALSKFKENMVTVMLADDMGVPPSKVPKAVKKFHEIQERYPGIYIPTYGHAGDGNLHTKFIMDPTEPGIWERAERANEEIFNAVLELGGTVTGEHGVSITKAPYFKRERADSLDAMRKIKRALDPNNILNPGKMFDWAEQGIVHFLRYKGRDVNGGKAIEALRKWEGVLNACTYCGFCKSVCPTLAALGWDSGGAKGRLMASYALLKGDLKPDDELVERIFSCTLCMDCTRRCPTSVDTAPIVEAARADLVRAGFRNPVHEAIIEKVRQTGNIYGETETAIKPREGTHRLFLGCAYGQRPNLVRLFIRVLEGVGIDPAIGEETCCGYVFQSLGYVDEAAEQKERFNAMVTDEEMITFCPSCTLHLREYFGRNARHALEVLADRLEEMSPRQLGKKVTYHDPCHLSRGAKIIDAPRRMMKAIGLELVEMAQSKDQSRCCGGGGGIITSAPDLSGELARARIEQAIDTGAQMLVTVCPTCELTLRQAAQAYRGNGNGNGKPPRVANLLDLVWKAVKVKN
jgi:glycolate oxidase